MSASLKAAKERIELYAQRKKLMGVRIFVRFLFVV